MNRRPQTEGRRTASTSPDRARATETEQLSVSPAAALKASLDAQGECAVSALEGGGTSVRRTSAGWGGYILLAPYHKSAKRMCRGGACGEKLLHRSERKIMKENTRLTL